MNAWILVLALANAENELGIHHTLESCMQQMSIIQPSADATVDCKPVTVVTRKETPKEEPVPEMGPTG